MTAEAETRRRPPTAQMVHRAVFVGFLLAAAAWSAAMLGVSLRIEERWWQLVFLLLALTTTLVGLARSLPWQNVLSVAALVAVISIAAQIINVNFSIPFGPRTYTDALGPQSFGVSWLVPVIWLVAILNARGVARLILRPWRKLGRYGFWMIGLACGLMVIFDFGLEPFASTVQTFWIWRIPRPAEWPAAPWSNSLGWAVTALLILVFTTPWLINKKPSRQAPVDYHPLVVWLLLNLLPAADCAAHQLWWPAVLGALAAAIVTIFAVRGARW